MSPRESNPTKRETRRAMAEWSRRTHHRLLVADRSASASPVDLPSQNYVIYTHVLGKKQNRVFGYGASLAEAWAQFQVEYVAARLLGLI